MLALAGEVGDGVCLNLMPAAVVGRQRAEVESGSAQVGRARPPLMARLQVMVTEDALAAREALRSRVLEPYLAQPVYNRFLAWMGYEEEAAAIASGWLARDRQAVASAVHDRLVDDLTLVGSRSQVVGRLDEYAEAGVDVAALSVLGDRAAVQATLSALAPR